MNQRKGNEWHTSERFFLNEVMPINSLVLHQEWKKWLTDSKFKNLIYTEGWLF